MGWVGLPIGGQAPHRTRRSLDVTRREIASFAVLYILFRGAEGAVKMGARRWSQTSSGPMGTIGDAVQVAL